MRNPFLSHPPVSDGRRDAQCACFAILRSLQSRLAGAGLCADDVWDYFLCEYEVSSRADFSEQTYVLLHARLSAAARDNQLFCVLCESVRRHKQGGENPIIPAFKSAWRDNKARLIDFLSAGFNANLSEGIILCELKTGIREQYAPRDQMDVIQWALLTADLELPTWEVGHWIHSLREQIRRKYEDRYPKSLGTIGDFRPPAEIATDAPVVKVFLSSYPKKLLYLGPRPVALDGYCQAFANKNSVTVEVTCGNQTTFFVSAAEQRYRGQQDSK